MTQQYTRYDRALTESNKLLMRMVTPRSEKKFDVIEFQFPPKMTTDNKGGEWTEAMQLGEEPIATYKSSGSREMTIQATYIVDGGVWTSKKIHDQLRILRGYFYRFNRSEAPVRDPLIIDFMMWEFGGPKRFTCRLKNVGVKYGDTMVGNPSIVSLGADRDPPGFKGGAFALRTDVTIDIRLWSAGDIPPDISDGASGAGGDGGQQDVQGLIRSNTFDWY